VLGTEYAHTYGSERRTLDALKPDMALIAAAHGLGLLVVDEIQRLSAFKSGGPIRMLDFFVQLVNTIGVPVLLIGTYGALPVLSGEFRMMRRSAGQGDLVWDRMREDAVWQEFVRRLWIYQYTETLTELTPALAHVLYEETQGVTDLAVKVFLLAQIRAIVTGKEKVTAAIIKSVAKDNLRLSRRVLQAMREGDVKYLSTFEDLEPLDFTSCVAREQSQYAPMEIAVTEDAVPTNETANTDEEVADVPRSSLKLARPRRPKRVTNTKPDEVSLPGIAASTGSKDGKRIADAVGAKGLRRTIAVSGKLK